MAKKEGKTVELAIVGCGFLIGVALLPTASQGAIAFTDQAAGAGLADARENNGGAFGDFDGDGDPDLLVFQLDRGEGALLYRNDGDGTFTDVSERVDAPSQVVGGAFVDWDGDGDLDIYLGPLFQSHQLHRNDGGFFTRVDLLSNDTINLAVTGAAFGDFDGDGRLDLFGSHRFFTPNRLFTRLDGAGFTDQSADLSGLRSGRDSLGAVPFDFDGDGDLDIYVINFGSANLLHRNDGDGVFRQAADGLGLDRAGVSIAGFPADYDNDGDLDLYLVNSFEEANTILRNEGGRFEALDAGAGLGPSKTGLGAAWGDWDNDGDLDLVVSHLRGVDVLENLGDGTFADIGQTALGDITPPDGRGIAVADYDMDGDVDIFVASRTGADRLLRNDSTDRGHWLRVLLEGRGDGQTVVGARVRVETATGVQLREYVVASMLGSLHGDLLHFGLGAAERVERLTVDWPSGQQQVLGDLPVDREVLVTEPRPRRDLGLRVIAPDAGPRWEPLVPEVEIENRGQTRMDGARLRLRVERGGLVVYEQSAPVPPLEPGQTESLRLGEWRPERGGEHRFAFLLEVDDDLPAGNAWERTYAFHVFADVASQAGVDDNGPGWAGAFCDYDNDGDLDLYLSNGGVQGGGANVLYRNKGDGTFEDVTQVSGTGDEGNGTGVVFADFDRDGFLDLFAGRGGFAAEGQSSRLFHNNGDGTFEDIAAAAGLDGARSSFGAVVGDYDRDGFIDLYVSQLGDQPDRLFHNEGDGTFTDASAARNIVDTPDYSGTAARFTDLDNDGDLDLYAAQFGTANILYADTGAGFVADAVGNPDGNTTGLALGDYDGDGDLDLYEINLNTASTLYRNDLEDLKLVDVTAQSGTEHYGPATGGTFGDYDNDGDLDLFVVNRGQPTRIYMNLGDGNFADMARSFGMADTVSAQSILLGDYDNDGDSDIYLITASGPNRLYRNEGTDNGWLQIRAVGTQSNIDGVAARIEVFAGGQVTMRTVESTDGSSQNSPLVQFGLGSQSRLDSLVLHWPSGRVDVHRRIPANSAVRLIEGRTATTVAEDSRTAPRDFSLEQNFPNPFNPRTAIRYRLPRAGRVRLTVYNIAGQLVRHLVDETAQAGQYQVFWEGADDWGRAVGNGVYLYRLQAGDLSATRRLVLLK